MMSRRPSYQTRNKKTQLQKRTFTKTHHSQPLMDNALLHLIEGLFGENRDEEAIARVSKLAFEVQLKREQISPAFRDGLAHTRWWETIFSNTYPTTFERMMRSLGRRSNAIALMSGQHEHPNVWRDLLAFQTDSDRIDRGVWRVPANTMAAIQVADEFAIEPTARGTASNTTLPWQKMTSTRSPSECPSRQAGQWTQSRTPTGATGRSSSKTPPRTRWRNTSSLLVGFKEARDQPGRFSLSLRYDTVVEGIGAERSAKPTHVTSSATGAKVTTSRVPFEKPPARFISFVLFESFWSDLMCTLSD